MANKAALFVTLTECAELVRRERQERLLNRAWRDPLGAPRDGVIEALRAAASHEADSRLYEQAFLRTEFDDELECAYRLQIKSESECYRSLEQTLQAAVPMGKPPGSLEAELTARAIYFSELFTDCRLSEAWRRR